eukprot:31551-Pelagococcus_subviridis.AAC.5
MRVRPRARRGLPPASRRSYWTHFPAAAFFPPPRGQKLRAVRRVVERLANRIRLLRGNRSLLRHRLFDDPPRARRAQNTSLLHRVHLCVRLRAGHRVLRAEELKVRAFPARGVDELFLRAAFFAVGTVVRPLPLQTFQRVLALLDPSPRRLERGTQTADAKLDRRRFRRPHLNRFEPPVVRVFEPPGVDRFLTQREIRPARRRGRARRAARHGLAVRVQRTTQRVRVVRVHPPPRVLVLHVLRALAQTPDVSQQNLLLGSILEKSRIREPLLPREPAPSNGVVVIPQRLLRFRDFRIDDAGGVLQRRARRRDVQRPRLGRRRRRVVPEGHIPREATSGRSRKASSDQVERHRGRASKAWDPGRRETNATREGGPNSPQGWACTARTRSYGDRRNRDAPQMRKRVRQRVFFVPGPGRDAPFLVVRLRVHLRLRHERVHAV